MGWTEQVNTDSEGHRAAIVDHPDFQLYDFGAYHPLRPERVAAGLELLETAGLWDRQSELLVPDVAPVEDIALVHSHAFIRAVDEAGSGGFPAGELSRYGLSSADNPPFPDMHYAAALVAGGTTLGMVRILSGQLDHAFNPAGGLHHAQRERASGFCIYNDPAVAAAVAARDFGARTFYIDLDCHHGDGVQWIFYDDPRVFTLSFHETGKYLFPGTGDVRECGEGTGLGHCVNVPFAPYTQDSSWQEALRMLIRPLVERFAPDVLITNHGCDTHIWDPLTHLALTTDSFVVQARLMHELAHEFCGGRWLAVGSGGYDWRRVVPRSWSILWAEMTCRRLPVDIPQSWARRWLTEAEEPHPRRMLDPSQLQQPTIRAAEIETSNKITVHSAARLAALA